MTNDFPSMAHEAEKRLSGAVGELLTQGLSPDSIACALATLTCRWSVGCRLSPKQVLKDMEEIWNRLERLQTDLGPVRDLTPEEKTAHFPMTVRGCARCNGVHESMEVRLFTQPPPTYKAWATCPTTGEPVLVAIETLAENPKT